MTGGGIALAFGGGVVSFLSPCVLPLVPVYLSVTTGLGVAELQAGGRRSLTVALRGAALFVAGFSAVFIAMGLSVTAMGATLLRNQVPITRAGGVVVAVLAVALFVTTMAGSRLVAREFRFHPNVARWGPWTAPVIGAAFAFGWTPCIGPVLGSVLAVAAGGGSIAHGGLLLAAYSAGLGIPFLACALGFHRVVGMLRHTRRHAVWLTRVSAGLLAGYGLLLAFDELSWVTLHLQQAVTAMGLSGLVTLG